MTDGPDDTPVRVLTTEILHRGWMTITRYTVERDARDGTPQRLVREIEDHGNSAAVLPLDPQRGTVLLARQFRLAAHLSGHDGRLIEACAGLIDEGETPQAAALREAREELGVDLHDLRLVAGAFVSPGASTEYARLFLARYTPADRVADGGGVDDGEDIEVLEMPLAEAVRAMAHGGIADAKTILLIQAAQLEQRGTSVR